MMPNKPSGDSGPTRLSGSGEVDWQKLNFPADKPQLEEMIMGIFVGSLPKQGGNCPDEVTFLRVLSYKQNQEYDLDFTLKTDRGDKLIDLMEIAPLKQLQGEYREASGAYTVGEFSDYIVEEIMKKALKYGALKHILLLCYDTHWAFRPSETVFNLIRVALLSRHHPFERVYHFSPIDSTFGAIEKLYPAPLQVLRYLDDGRYRNNKVTNLPPDGWQPQ